MRLGNILCLCLLTSSYAGLSVQAMFAQSGGAPAAQDALAQGFVTPPDSGLQGEVTIVAERR
jgi:hypothetical protein